MVRDVVLETVVVGYVEVLDNEMLILDVVFNSVVMVGNAGRRKLEAGGGGAELSGLEIEG